jgi:hypothetical protein
MKLNEIKQKEMEGNGREWKGMEGNGREWKGMEGNGMEGNGREWKGREGNEETKWKGMKRPNEIGSETEYKIIPTEINLNMK